MIDIQVQVHDNFSVEFKVGYRVDTDVKENDFVMNTWIFIPNSLDINSFTYSKKQFYRDVKSHVRLITPIYDLGSIVSEGAQPCKYLTQAVRNLIADASDSNRADHEYQVKMFGAIVKSALRKRVDDLLTQEKEIDTLLPLTLSQLDVITKYYRDQSGLLDVKVVPATNIDYYRFADEFISNSIEQQCYRLLEESERRISNINSRYKDLIVGYIAKEVNYKKSKGYMTASIDDNKMNRSLIYRRRALKKYIESHLFLSYNKKREGMLAEQVYYSVAAGISMIFATVIAFSFQNRFGNFTMPLFIALVISYMLKDRIKELMRYYFVKRMAKKFFDNKTTIHVKRSILGWMKESVDFVSEQNIPSNIISIRGRSNLLEADNRTTKEKIILYRKLVRIDGEVLDLSSDYITSGINNILRFNFWNFIQKMDNPEIPLPVLTDGNNFTYVMGEKVYYINILVQFECDGSENFRRYRITMTRDGIKEIEKL